MIGLQLFIAGVIILVGVIAHIVYRCGGLHGLDILYHNIDFLPFWMPIWDLLTYRAMILSSFGLAVMGAILAAMHF